MSTRPRDMARLGNPARRAEANPSVHRSLEGAQIFSPWQRWSRAKGGSTRDTWWRVSVGRQRSKTKNGRTGDGYFPFSSRDPLVTGRR